VSLSSRNADSHQSGIGNVQRRQQLLRNDNDKGNITALMIRQEQLPTMCQSVQNAARRKRTAMEPGCESLRAGSTPRIPLIQAIRVCAAMPTKMDGGTPVGSLAAERAWESLPMRRSFASVAFNLDDMFQNSSCTKKSAGYFGAALPMVPALSDGRDKRMATSEPPTTSTSLVVVPSSRRDDTQIEPSQQPLQQNLLNAILLYRKDSIFYLLPNMLTT